MADALKRRLLEVILMLVGMRIFYVSSTVLVGYVAFDVNSDLREFVYSYYLWIGKVIFGVVMLLMIYKHNRKVALPITILSAFSPEVGCMFYLIASTISTDKLNQWFIDLLDS